MSQQILSQDSIVPQTSKVNSNVPNLVMNAKGIRIYTSRPDAKCAARGEDEIARDFFSFQITRKRPLVKRHDPSTINFSINLRPIDLSFNLNQFFSPLTVHWRFDFCKIGIHLTTYWTRSAWLFRFFVFSLDDELYFIFVVHETSSHHLTSRH